MQEDGEEEEAGAELEARLQAAASEAEEGMTETDLPRESSSAPSTILNPLRALSGQPLKRVKQKIKGGYFLGFFSYCIQHCFICRPSDSTVPTNAGIEPRTVAIVAFAVRRSNH